MKSFIFDETNNKIWREADIFIPAAASRLYLKQLDSLIDMTRSYFIRANVFADKEIFFGPISKRVMIELVLFLILLQIAAWHETYLIKIIKILMIKIFKDTQRLFINTKHIFTKCSYNNF